MSKLDKIQKRTFDLIVSLAGLLLLWPIILLCIIVATFDTKKFGIFCQTRIGKNKKPFVIYKVRTMHTVGGSTVTTSHDSRITRIGGKLRTLKLDELPQVINVLRGDMSFVGPRPDVPGYLDLLGPEWDEVISLRPGITGPATLFFRNEESLLADAKDPKVFNDEYVWPKKLELNMEYAKNWSLCGDVKYILRTLRK